MGREPPTRPPAGPVVACHGLVRLYDTATGRVQAVRGVDLSVEAATVVAVVGPSGCGKSSLLRMVAGIDRPTAGMVVVDGVDLWRLGERARAAARARVLTHVHQRPDDNLFDHHTVEQQLARVVPGHHDRAAVVDEVLDELDLGHRRAARPDRLSGGERQRLAFGKAAAAGHRVVIADEPTSQLDAAGAAALLETMRLLARRGSTVVVATHDRRVLAGVDRIVALRDGAVATVTEAGTPWSVIDATGRIQLPPEVLDRFPERRVRLRPDEATGRVELEGPT